MRTSVIVTFAITIAFAACSKKAVDALGAGPAPADPVCNAEAYRADLAKKLGKEFDVKVARQIVPQNARPVVTATRVIRAIDGQRLGWESQTVVLANDRGRCVSTIVEVRRKVGSEERVSDLLENVSRFYRNSKLIYRESPLRQPAWLKQYIDSRSIPERLPSELTKDGTDLYMTWVACDDDKACRIPVWVQEGIWTRDANNEFTLIAGQVAFKNPAQHKLTADDFFFVMRLDQKSVVNFRGILFPVSKTTYDRYLAYQRSSTEEWTKDEEADEKEVERCLDGALSRPKGKAMPMPKVWDLREVRPADLPSVPNGFTPSLDELKPLF